MPEQEDTMTTPVRETAHERLRRHNTTVQLDVRLDALRDYARGLVVDTFRETWMSSGGVLYRKNGAQRVLDYTEARVACTILADYLGQGRDEDHLRSELMEEAIAAGELVRTVYRVHPPGYEDDAAYVASLPVRTRR